MLSQLYTPHEMYVIFDINVHSYSAAIDTVKLTRKLNLTGEIEHRRNLAPFISKFYYRILIQIFLYFQLLTKSNSGISEF